MPKLYSGEYPRLSRGRPGFDSPPGSQLYVGISLRIKAKKKPKDNDPSCSHSYWL